MARRTTPPSELQKAAWRKLPQYCKWLIANERPDDFERDLNLRHSVMTALENVYGPRSFGPDYVAVAEGEDDESRYRSSGSGDYAATLEEIGAHFGVCKETARKWELDALRTFRDHWELLTDEGMSPTRQLTLANHALRVMTVRESQLRWHKRRGKFT